MPIPNRRQSWRIPAILFATGYGKYNVALIFARDGGSANVTTLLERRSRYVVLLPNPDRRPAGLAERIGAALDGLATDLRRTVTFDGGFEFMGYPVLDRRTGMTSDFCDPRSRCVLS